jgi:hypothetical protein
VLCHKWIKKTSSERQLLVASAWSQRPCLATPVRTPVTAIFSCIVHRNEEKKLPGSKKKWIKKTSKHILRVVLEPARHKDVSECHGRCLDRKQILVILYWLDPTCSVCLEVIIRNGMNHKRVVPWCQHGPIYKHVCMQGKREIKFHLRQMECVCVCDGISKLRWRPMGLGVQKDKSMTEKCILPPEAVIA